MKSLMFISVLLVFFLFVLGAKVHGQTQFRCDYKFNQEVGGWLKLHEVPATWRDARLRCQLEGAVLASPTPSLAKAMRNLAIEGKISCGLFTGVHAIISKGDYASIEGVPLANIPHEWSKDEPRNFKNEEQCLVLLRDGTVADARCKDTFPYICYKKNTNLSITNCGTSDPAYTHDGRTGKCYKFHRVPRSFSRSYMACMAEGGHLAIINSEAEAQIIRDLFVRNPPETMVGNFWKNVAYLGFWDWGEHGEWRTIHGQTLEEAGYAKWSEHDPNNATTGEFCGACYNTALIVDIWCENPYPFICEKDPSSLLTC